MTKAFRQDGKSITITGVSAANIPAGSLYRRSGGSATARAWIGVVTDDIHATTSVQTTLDGRPILIGDGVAAEAQTGEGKGDMFIEGVFTLRLPASGTLVLDGDPLYGVFTNSVASGVTDNALVSSPYTNFGALSGALVGFAVGGNYTATVAPYAGLNVVDVKLLGLPLHDLATAGPATAT